MSEKRRTLEELDNAPLPTSEEVPGGGIMVTFDQKAWLFSEKWNQRLHERTLEQFRELGARMAEEREARILAAIIGDPDADQPQIVEG